MAVQVVDDANAGQLLAAGVAVLDFWATWCGPCRAFAPVFAAAAERHPQLLFGKVDVDAAPELARRFGVLSVPTVVVLRDGQPVTQRAGALPAAAFEQLLASVL